MQFEKGKLVISNNGEKLDIWEKNGNKLLKIKNQKLKIRPMMQNAVNHIVKVLKNESENNICNGYDGLKVIELIESIEKKSKV